MEQQREAWLLPRTMIFFGTPQRRRLCIGAIVYNEAPYLLEWIAHHLEQGIEHFFIGDHDSDDGTTALLEGLQMLGYVTRLFHPRVFEGNAQRSIYEQIIALTQDEPHLVAFIDADEFLVPSGDDETAGDAIRELLSPARTGALGINWRMFGSSGRIEPGAGLVVERFLQCNESDARINRHIKSVVKPDCVRSVEVHRCKLKLGYRYVNTEGVPTAFDATSGFARDIPAVQGRVRIHHYVVKSYREFIDRKAKRGRATLGPGNRRNMKFFRGHDKSGVVDSSATRFADAIRTRVRTLESALAASQYGCTLTNVEVTRSDAAIGGSFDAHPALLRPALCLTEYLDEGFSRETVIPLVPMPEGQHPHAATTYGFTLSLPSLGSVRRRHGHRLRVFANDTLLLDAREPSAFLPVAESASASIPERPDLDVVGEVDRPNAARISGWVRRYLSPDPVQVQLFNGKRRIALQMADQFRPDALSMCRHPSGHCGFLFDLAAMKLPADGAYRVRVVGTRYWVPTA